MVKRYDVYDRNWDMAFNTQEDPKGDWVKYEDVRKLLTQIEHQLDLNVYHRFPADHLVAAIKGVLRDHQV